MSKVDRKNPKRSSASESRYSIFEFDREFPDDDACLDRLWRERYPTGRTKCPKCSRVSAFHREAGRPSWECQWCGHHIHPMVGTIFENSATSMRLWFYAIYLMASTRCGISAKQLERELGVTYKTAWRMFRQIRSLLAQGDGFLMGTVEVDEAFIGGKAKWKKSGDRPVGRGTTDKTILQGFAERGRRGAKIVANIVPNTGSGTLIPAVYKRVLPGSTVYTDEWMGYKTLGRKGYKHTRVNHTERVYVIGDAHTNSLEGFWSLLKRGISGVYHGVSTKHLQSYVDEYVFRYNNRLIGGRGMFDAFLSLAVQPKA